MLDPDLNRSMLRYYDERAPEYEDAYLKGTGTSSIREPDVFVRDVAHLPSIVEKRARGRLIDLACGTAFWLPYYAPQCISITLLDQSERMLDESRRKVNALGVGRKTTFVRADVFEHELPDGAFDSLLVGFFLSHLTEAQEPRFFDLMRRLLSNGGHFLLLDSAWTPERAAVNQKTERQSRQLNDGTRFEIHKRYLDRHDVSRWERISGAEMAVEHLGPAFIAVSGSYLS